MKREKNGSPFFSGQTVWQTKGIKHGAQWGTPLFLFDLLGPYLYFRFPSSVFWLNKHIECQFSLHVHNNMSTLVLSVTGNFLHYYCVL